MATIEKEKALGVVRQMVADGQVSQDVAEKYFPELAESEDKDERIRKSLSAYFAQFKPNDMWNADFSFGDIVAWFEKQCNKNPAKNIVETWKGMRLEVYQQASGNRHEPNCSDDTTKMFSLNDIDEIIEKLSDQKPVDEVEPKLHEGDWVVYNNDICQIVKREEGCNKLVTVFGIEKELVNERNLSTARLWTIKDAKPGDMLATIDHILIFEKLLPKDGGVSYCHYDFGCSTPQFDFNKDDNWYFGKEAKVYPATKEQRDTLLKAMADAGYEWDSENRELKKIDHEELTDFQERLRGILIESNGKYDDNTVIRLSGQVLELVEQYSAEWSEGDEKEVAVLEAYIRSKDWSERHIDRALGIVDELVNKVKSLRPQK